MPKGRPWTEEDDAILREMITSGMMAKHVAERLGRSRGSVIGRACRTGVQFPDRPPRKTTYKKPRPYTIHVIRYEDEEIARGTNLTLLCEEVRDVLNEEQPPGEKPWTAPEVKKMAGVA